MSRPIGAMMRSRSSGVGDADLGQALHALVVGLAAAHHADVADPAGAARPAMAGTSNFGSWVSTHTASRGPSVGPTPLEQAVRPVDDDLVGHREAALGGEDLAGVAHRDAVAEHLGHPGQRGGEVDGAEDQHLRRRGEALDEDVDRVSRRPRRGWPRRPRRSGGRRCGPPRARRGRRGRRRGRGRGRRAMPSGGLARVAPAACCRCPGPSMTVASATGCSARRRVARASRRCVTAGYQSSGSMNRWIVPPHVSPTANASSSQ